MPRRKLLLLVLSGCITLSFGFRCPQPNGYFRDPQDCAKFYHCNRGVARQRDCAPGTLFDERKKVCNWPAKVDCPIRSSRGGEATTDFRCEVSLGYFPDPDDCSKYYQCAHGRAIHRTCAPGTHFDNRIKVCNWPHLADCSTDNKLVATTSQSREIRITASPRRRTRPTRPPTTTLLTTRSKIDRFPYNDDDVRTTDVASTPGIIVEPWTAATDDSEQSAFCGSHISVSSPGISGVFYSPGYQGNRYYPDRVSCNWLIQVPSGSRVSLTFKYFNVEAGNLCQYDSLSVYDGASPRDPLIGKFCGSVKKSIATSSNFVFLHFVSDESYTERGFEIEYLALEEDESMCNKTIHAVHGGITSPPDHVTDTVCITSLHLEPGAMLLLEVKSFKLRLADGEGEIAGTGPTAEEEGASRNTPESAVETGVEGPEVARIPVDGAFQPERARGGGVFREEGSPLVDRDEGRWSKLGGKLVNCDDDPHVWVEIIPEGRQGLTPIYIVPEVCKKNKYPMNITIPYSVVHVKFQRMIYERFPFFAAHFFALYENGTIVKDEHDDPMHRHNFAETDSLWSEWSEWSDCTVTCGQGSRIRRRQCLTIECHGHCDAVGSCTEKCYNDTCVGSPVDYEECYMPVCPKGLHFLLEPKNATVSVGEVHTFECLVDRQATIKWLKDDEQILNPEKLDALIRPPGTVLILLSVTALHAGKYTCLAVGHDKSLSASHAWLQVLGDGETCSVQFDTKPQDVYAEAGELRVLECRVQGATISWLRDNERVIPDGRVGVISEGYLMIQDIDASDSGLYTCVAVLEDGCIGRTEARIRVRAPQTVEQVCGIPILSEPLSTLPALREGKIVGGQDSTKGSAPWLVMMWTSELGPFCAGSLINREWIITAAHCFIEYYNMTGHSLTTENLVLKLGKHDSQRRESQEIVMRARDIAQHPRFSLDTYDNDIALIRLNEPVSFNDYITPICLAAEKFHNRNFFSRNGGLGVVTGWGRLAEKGDRPRYTQEISLPVVDTTACKASTKFPVTKNMFCAGYFSEVIGDPCKGDSGGPFIMKHSGRWYLVGMVSWGEGCARHGKYGFYTKVSRYHKTFIQEHIEELR